MGVSTVDPKQQNSLVRSENVTYHIFSGEKTHCNQTGGCDWTRDETQTEITTRLEDSERQTLHLLHLVHTCKEEGDLAGQLGSLGVPSAERVSDTNACSNREADGKLQGEKKVAQQRATPPPAPPSGFSEEMELPRMPSQPADT